MFPIWQNRIREIRETDELEIFQTFIQENTEEVYDSLAEAKQINNVYLQNAERSEYLAKELIKKVEISIVNKQTKLTNKGLNILVKRSLRRLNKDIKKYKELVRERQNNKSECVKFHKEVQSLQQELQQEREVLELQIEYKRQELFKGLTPERIRKFQRFQADQSLAGDRCGVCLDDIEVGRRMTRLDCDGHHVFCQGCVEGWFADKNTCPKCRHTFA